MTEESSEAPTRTLRDLLGDARHRAFVGRDEEIGRVLGAIRDPAAGPRVHFVHGPGGIGKSALLQEIELRCADQSIDAVRLDARDLRESQRLVAEVRLAARSARVVLVDNFLPGRTSEEWLRRDLLPSLPAEVHLLLARRQPPDRSWRTDLGWRDLVQVVALRGFERGDTEAFLAGRGVAEEHHDELHRLTGGHPLALALAVESRHTAEGEGVPFSVIEGLLDRLREEVPSPRHFAALEAASVVRTVQEPLLRHLLADSGDAKEVEEADGARAVFDWLAGLSFVERTSDGLRPHDVVRSVLRAHVAWRDPARLRRTYDLAQSWYLERLVELADQPHGPGALHATLGLAFLHHANEIGREYMELAHDEMLRTVPAESDDKAAARAMVERHQGAEAAHCFDLWAGAQPDQVFVSRGSGPRPLGMVQYVLLSNEVDQELVALDPATAAIWAWVAEHGPLRGGERILLTRFWMDAERHQGVTAVGSNLWIHTTIRYRLLPRLAWGIALFAQPDAWAQPFEYMDFHRVRGADIHVGEHAYGAFAHDWRVLPVQKWNQLLSERRLDPHAERPPRARHVIVLARTAFADAVRDALRTYARPADLAGNPLLASSLVLDRLDKRSEADATERSKILRDLLEEAAEALAGDVRGDKLHRALAATYLEPEGTQEEIAEHLDLPFTTYRRHLTAAVQDVVDRLWAQETGEDVVRPE